MSSLRPSLLLVGLALGPFLTETVADGSPDRSPMTPRELWSMSRPSALAISPDGSRIAYQMTIWDLEEGTANSDLWLVGTDGGNPVRLTWQPGRDASPVWSTDGAFLYFVSSRGEDASQLHRLPSSGGEAERMTNLPRGISGFALSGDSHSALVSASSDRNCSDLACVLAKDETAAERKATGRIFDGLLYRHWDSWRGDDRSHVYLVDLTDRDAKPVDLTPGDVDSPPVSLGSAHDFVLSPAGGHAAIVANRAEMVAASTDNDVELIDLATGKRSVVSTGDGSDVGPRFSSDGKHLAWISMRRPGYESDRHELVRHQIETGEQIRFIAQEPDLSIADFELIEGVAALLFTAQLQGRMHLYKGDIASGRVSRIAEGGRISALTVDEARKRAFFVRGSAGGAPEIYALSLDSLKTRRLTGHNDALLETLDLGKVDEMWFEGAGGDDVHAWIIHPPASAVAEEGTIPVIYLIHGGPQGAWLDDQHQRWSMQQFAAFGYYVVAVNFHGSTGYGQGFTDSINQSWGGRPYEDLQLGLDAITKKLPRADLDRVCAAGGSYGGYMVNWLLGHDGDRFRCFMSHAGVYDLRSMYGATEELWFPEWDLGGTFWDNPSSHEMWSPSASAGSFETPTLVIHGQLDFRVPVTQGMQLFTALQRQGVPSRFLYYPDEGHWILSPANAFLWWSEIESWFDRWLGDPDRETRSTE